MPRLDRALPELPMSQPPLPLPTNRAFVVQLRAQSPRGPMVLGRVRRACGVGADDALPLPEGVAGVHDRVLNDVQEQSL